MSFLDPSTGKRIPVSSPDHPAAAWIQEASDAADQGIELHMESMTSTLQTNSEAGARILSAIERALEITPDDADLLVARAGARMFAPGDDEVPDILRRALDIEPDHFDARMRLEHPSWENLFLFPSFSEDMGTLPQVMGQYLELGQMVQVVRNKLELSLAVVVPGPSEGFPHVDRSRWELMWVETPYGPIAEHYLIIEVQGEARSAEACVPHLAEPEPGARNAYWILRRMPHVRSMVLAFADGHRVLHSSEYELPPKVHEVLARMDGDLERTGPATDMGALQQAANYHVQTFDPGTLRF